MLKYSSVRMKDQEAILDLIRVNGGIRLGEVRAFYPTFTPIKLRRRIGRKALTVYECSKGHTHLWLYKTKKADSDKHNKKIFDRNFKGELPKPFYDKKTYEFRCNQTVKQIKKIPYKMKIGRRTFIRYKEKIVSGKCNELVRTQIKEYADQKKCYKHRRW